MASAHRILPEPTLQEIKRFWLKVVVRNADDCWLYMAGKDRAGYGEFYYRGRRLRANRAAYFFTYGIDPGELLVRHYQCDNPPCCNPSHLKPGTPKQNTGDMLAKKRQASGKRHGRYTQPEKTARGERHRSRTHPESLPRGDDNPSRKYPGRLKRGEENNKAVLTKELVQEMRSRHAEGIGFRQLAREYGYQRSTVTRAVKGITWKHVD